MTDQGRPTGLVARGRARGLDRATVLAAVWLAVSVSGYLVVRAVTDPTMVDLHVYQAEGLALRRGLDLYGALPGVGHYRATYPPFAALFFVPLSYLPSAVASALVVTLTVGLLVVCGWLSARLVGVPAERRAAAALVVSGLAIWAEPVFTTLRYGQIDLVLLALVLWDFTRPPTSRWRGIALGLATGVKVVPGLFVVYLLFTGRIRMAAVAGGTFALTLLVSGLAAPGSTWSYWTVKLLDTDRVGRPENAANQSVRGMVVRITHTREPSAWWLLASVGILVLGLAIAVRAHQRLGDGWGVPACAVAGLLGGPISWTHHWVWCIPITLLLWEQARRWVPLVVVFWTFAVWAIPHTDGRELTLSAGQLALSGWYVLFGLAFLAVTLARSTRPPPNDRVSSSAAGWTGAASW